MAHVFDPEVLHEVARSVLGRPLQELVPLLAERLAERYPGHIDREPEWVFNNAGGAMGTMAVLHASLTEYVLVFGSPIGTEGHSGRFPADDWFFILDGEQWAYEADQFERSVYRPGDMNYMPRGTARGYRIPDHCYAMEYARGVIPLLLPFGLADSVLSTLDFRSVARTFRIYAKAVARELRQGKI